MSYPSCADLVNLDATCDAIKKVGGVTARVWFGKKRDFIDKTANQYFFKDDPSSTFGVNVWILHYDDTAIANTELAFFEGVQLKHTGSFELVPGGNVNAYTHNVNLVLYQYTQAQLQKLQTLMLTEDVICIMLTEAGQFKVYGADYIKTEPELLTKLGLKSSAGNGGDIVDFQGEVGFNIQLSATNMETPPFIMNAVLELDSNTEYTSVEDIVTQLNNLASANA